MKLRHLFAPLSLCVALMAVTACELTPEPPVSADSWYHLDSSSEATGESSAPSAGDDSSSSSGPTAASVPGDAFRDDDPDNPYHEPDVEPISIAAETSPSDYNIYVSAPSSHDAIWAWSANKSIGLIPAIKSVSIEGVDGYSFAAIYLSYNQYYYDYSSWAFDAEGFFLMEEDDPFTGLLLRSSSDGESKTGDISVASVEPMNGITNIYVIEKEDGSIGAFGSAEEAASFAKNDTAPVSPADATSPGDVNIYTYCPWGNQYRNNIWAWGSSGSVGFDTLKDGVSKEITLDGIGNATFNAIYLTFGTVYRGQSDWSGASSTTFSISESNFFTGMILRELGGDQSDDLSMPSLSEIEKDSEGHRNIYLIEIKDESGGNKKVNVYTDLSDVQTYFASI